MLFLITQQFSLLVPDLQAVPVDYVMISTQRFGGFERHADQAYEITRLRRNGVHTTCDRAFARVLAKLEAGGDPDATKLKKILDEKLDPALLAEVVKSAQLEWDRLHQSR